MRSTVRLCLAAGVLLGLGLIGGGLVLMLQLDRSPEAIGEARTGSVLLLVGSLLVLAIATATWRQGQRRAAGAISSPALLCGGIALVASDSLLPHLAALPTFPAAVTGAAALLAATPARRRHVVIAVGVVALLAAAGVVWILLTVLG